MRKLVFIFIFSFLTLFTAYIDAAPVYIAKDSRAYHYNRNCSDLNTTDLIEFASPQKADDAGAIPCKHCNSSDIIMIDKEKQSSKVSNAIQTEINSNEGVYVGDLKNGVRHGHGTTTYADGTKYVGGWKDGNKHGHGTLTISDGRKYVGEWKDDKMHGQGTHTFFPEGTKYVGNFKDGKMHGHGTLTFSNGKKYVGEWKDNKRHGQGTFTYANGDKYVGEWKDGKQHGQGTSISADGVKYVGEFKDHKPHGQGTVTYANGDKYVDEWKDGNRYDSSLDVSIQSFSIKGLTIGMPALQADKLKWELIRRADDGLLSFSSINTGRNNNEKIVYSIKWNKRFKNYEKADDILMKLQETYGKWSDIYRSKKNYYYVIWGAKFKKNITENTEWILRETVDNNTSYATDCITGKLFLMARIAPYDDGVCDLSLRLHNNKIYTDALKAEIAREKQQKMKQQEDISKLKFR